MEGKISEVNLSIDKFNVSIGKKMKALRTEKQYTLKNLGDLTGLSTGFLSQLERGMTTVAIDSLGKIAAALNVDLSYFFITNQNEEEKTDMYKDRAESSFIVRSYERNVVNIGAEFVQYDLAVNLQNKSMMPRIIDLMPLVDSEEPTNEFQHDGEEFVYVLEGVLSILIDHVRYDLFPGDSAYFESCKMHNWRNNTNKMVKILVLNTPNPLKTEKKD